MLDIKEIRENPERVEAKIKTKVPDASLSELVAMDEELRELKTRVEGLKATRNEVSKKIGERKRNGESAQDLLDEVAGFATEIHTLDHQVTELERRFQHELSKLPNLPMDDIKISADPADNVIVKEWGQKREWDFTPKNHLELNENLRLFDFQRGTKLAGSGWPVYRGNGARMEWALINYMMSIHLKNGFEQWMPPAVVKDEILFGAGQLPKFENQQYKLDDVDYPFYLIPTAEVSLNGLHYDEILDEELPLKYMAYTPCFRREAGAAGEKERGLIRVHQFNKVEMFVFCEPQQSAEMFDMMVASAEEILQGLGLHYRNALLVTGDMSFSGARTIDVEVWLPGQDRYYEVSSVSNCTDYQARRARIRYRPKEGEKPEFVHTLNGSGLATSRLMVSLLENNQQADGSVTIPEVLRPYMDGLERLTPIS